MLYARDVPAQEIRRTGAGQPSGSLRCEIERETDPEKFAGRPDDVQPDGYSAQHRDSPDENGRALRLIAVKGCRRSGRPINFCDDP
jgi:hypothetical protein